MGDGPAHASHVPSRSRPGKGFATLPLVTGVGCHPRLRPRRLGSETVKRCPAKEGKEKLASLPVVALIISRSLGAISTAHLL